MRQQQNAEMYLARKERKKKAFNKQKQMSDPSSALSAVSGIAATDLKILRTLAIPPKRVVDVLTAVALLLSDGKAAEWKPLIREDRDTFVQTLTSVDLTTISPKTIDAVKNVLPDLEDLEKSQKVGGSIGKILNQWVLAVVNSVKSE